MFELQAAFPLFYLLARTGYIPYSPYQISTALLISKCQMHIENLLLATKTTSELSNVQLVLLWIQTNNLGLWRFCQCLINSIKEVIWGFTLVLQLPGAFFEIAVCTFVIDSLCSVLCPFFSQPSKKVSNQWNMLFSESIILFRNWSTEFHCGIMSIKANQAGHIETWNMHWWVSAWINQSQYPSKQSQQEYCSEIGSVCHSIRRFPWRSCLFWILKVQLIWNFAPQWWADS